MHTGDFLLHLGEELRQRVRQAAKAEGISMSQYLLEGLEMRMSAGPPGEESLTQALRMVELAARRLADERALKPSSDDSWDAVMVPEER